MTTDAIGGGSFDIIKEPWPLTEVAVLRFWIALTSDGLPNEIPAEVGWAAFASRCRGGFPSKVIEAILAPLAARTNVLDPDHDGLFDGPAVARIAGWSDPNGRQPVSRFLPELPAGTKSRSFQARIG